MSGWGGSEVHESVRGPLANFSSAARALRRRGERVAEQADATSDPNVQAEIAQAVQRALAGGMPSMQLSMSDVVTAMSKEPALPWTAFFIEEGLAVSSEAVDVTWARVLDAVDAGAMVVAMRTGGEQA